MGYCFSTLVRCSHKRDKKFYNLTTCLASLVEGSVTCYECRGREQVDR